MKGWTGLVDICIETTEYRHCPYNSFNTLKYKSQLRAISSVFLSRFLIQFIYLIVIKVRGY